jgi:N-acyl-D-amino-acid deacylase
MKVRAVRPGPSLDTVRSIPWIRAIRCVPLLAAPLAACTASGEPADILILGGSVIDGSGSEATTADVAVDGDRIHFVGDAAGAGIAARDTVDARGLLVAPGFIDMHSHAELDTEHGRDARAFLFQGITTVALGLDGGGSAHVADQLAVWTADGIGVNAFLSLGHNWVRRQVLGMADRAPTGPELDEMRALVRKGMEEGAHGLSSGLFYLPGNYAETDEVIELNRVAAGYPGAIYDTHDRDLGAAYPPFGYLKSIEEGIRVGEEAGTKVIFSHFNAQGAHNYGRAPEGAALIEAARARGVEVAGAHHSYTATQSNLRSYTIPSWFAAGGDTAMLRRFDDPDTVEVIDRQTREMLAIRGGADRLLFADQRPELNGRTLQEVADELGMEPAAAGRHILREGNAAVMNLGLYDIENVRYLAQLDWMMTCTDGRDPGPTRPITHPRAFGSFSKKIRDLVLDEGLITLPHAVRSMTGLAADFLEWPERGYLREGYFADIAVLRLDAVRDMATYEDPHRYSEGTVHVLVNGVFAIRGGEATMALGGRALVRGGAAFEAGAARSRTRGR